MIQITASEYYTCDFCGGAYQHLKDISTVDGKTVTICKHCRKDLAMSLIRIEVD